MQAGQCPQAFWKQTPRLIVHVLNGYRERMRIEHESNVYHALLSESLARWPKNKRLPTLKALLGDKKGPPKPQAPSEVIANARAWGF